MAIMDTPTKLNGYPVTRVEQHKNCATVMVDKGDEYVVATWWPELKSSWSWGHYFGVRNEVERSKTYAEAVFDFNKTATRNTTR